MGKWLERVIERRESRDKKSCEIPKINTDKTDTMKENQTKPYLTLSGDLAIPFDSDPRYHWWKPGGRRFWEIKEELLKQLVN
jgi:hypothetical protein